MQKPKKQILIVGAGDFGRELYSWISTDGCRISGEEYTFGGFVDDDQHALTGYEMISPGIVCSLSNLIPEANTYFLLGISNPVQKMAVAQSLLSIGVSFLTYIHPSVLVGQHVKIGVGCVICPNVVISCNAILGDFVSLNIGATVGHDVAIGQGSTLSSHSDVTGFAVLGESVFLGSHAVVLPKARVGDHARVGAGSVILKSLSAKSIAMGVPAKEIFQ